MAPDSTATLGPLVIQRRTELGLSLRQASEASGVPVTTLSRVEQGRTPDLATFRRIVEWLGLSPDRFFTPTTRAADTLEAISVHLRTDPTLSREAADRIADIVRDLYTNLSIKERRLGVHLKAAKTFKPQAMNLLADILHDVQASLDMPDEV